jgi:selenocysteine lyase/cysteine desulfurase
MNWERTRSFFPVTQTLAYLNHAGVAPISTRVAEALARYIREATHKGASDYARGYDAEIERVRGRAAALIGAQRDEIAFVKNTSEGLGLVAAGLDWQRGDRVVVCDLEYPSNVYAWWSLRSRGVETVMLRGRDGALPLESVEAALAHPRTRLLALSSVEFGSGARNDLPALGRLCRERGVLFCVDAIQSLGCLPLDVTQCHIDFLAADGHKWLLSVEGCGLFFCRRALIERLTPRVVGWRSVTDNLDFDRYHFDLQPGAGRFEEGTPNTPGIFALGAAIDLLLELGVEAIGQRVLELGDALCAGLAARGAVIASPRGPGQTSGIVAFTLPDEAPARTAARLRAAGVFVVERRACVRASPHFYNTQGDLDRLLRAL